MNTLQSLLSQLFNLFRKNRTLLSQLLNLFKKKRSLLCHFEDTPESRYYCRLLSTPLEKRCASDQRILELLSQRLTLLSYCQNGNSRNG